MVIVFLFLGILVLLMTILSRIIQGIHARREAKAAGVPAPEAEEHVAIEREGAYEESEDLSAVAAAVAMCFHRGADKNDIAAVLGAIAAAGGPVPRGKSREVAAAIAVVTSHKNIR
jgi:Na+-transporting methylmalonyl-CoA/oxaloacetate decarboxylase gamma subunit